MRGNMGKFVKLCKKLPIGYLSFPRFGSFGVASGNTLDLILYKQLEEQNLLTEEQQHYYLSRRKYLRQIYASTKPSSGVFLNTASLQAISDTIEKYILEPFKKEAKIYKDVDELAEGVYNRSLASGGSTTYTNTGLAVTTGYALAAVKEANQRVPELTPEIIRKYIEKYYDPYLKREGVYLGTWKRPDGEWDLDCSITLLDKKQAIEQAKNSKEDAIYDLFEDKQIFVQQ